MYSIMCITKYFRNSWLHSFHGRVTASWDVCVCVCLYFWMCAYVCVNVEARYQSWLSLLRSLAFCDTGFPPQIWCSLVRLDWLPWKSRDLPPQVQTQALRLVWVHYWLSVFLGSWDVLYGKTNTLVFLFVGMFEGASISHCNLEFVSNSWQSFCLSLPSAETTIWVTISSNVCRIYLGNWEKEGNMLAEKLKKNVHTFAYWVYIKRMVQTFQDKNFYKIELTYFYLKLILLLSSFNLKVSFILFYYFIVNETQLWHLKWKSLH